MRKFIDKITVTNDRLAHEIIGLLEKNFPYQIDVREIITQDRERNISHGMELYIYEISQGV